MDTPDQRVQSLLKAHPAIRGTYSLAAQSLSPDEFDRLESLLMILCQRNKVARGEVTQPERREL